MKKLIITLTVLILVVAVFHPGFAATNEEPVVTRLRVTGESPRHARQVRRIIPLQEDERLTLTDIARTISLLRKTGLYEKIHIEEKKTLGGVEIIVDLTPRRFIHTLKFEKAFPLFESELRKAIRTREGMPYNEEKIRQDIRLLEAYLQQEGYFESNVQVSAEPDRKTGDVIVTFSITKGFTYSLDDINVEGNRRLSDMYIKYLVRKSVLLRYRKKKLDNGVESILKAYHNRGFYEAEVQIEEIELDPKFYTVTVRLKINEGPRAKIIIKGDKHATERSIEKRLTFAEHESVDKFEVTESAFRIAEMYRSRGYKNVEVNWTINQKKDSGKANFTEITFQIDEGRQIHVRDVTFPGAESFKPKKLHKQIITGRRKYFGKGSRLVDEVLKEDIAALETFYHKWGYEGVKVGPYEVKPLNDKGNKVTVAIPIREGPQTVVRDVEFKGVEFFQPDFIFNRLTLIPGAPFNPSLLPGEKRKLLLMYADYGFPYAKVSQKVERVSPNDAGPGVVITYSVVENKRVTVGETLIRGNYRTKGRVLTREVELYPGEPFSYSELLESRRNLRGLPFLYSSRLETLGLEENMDTAHLLIDVMERPARSLDFGVGYDSDLGSNIWIELSDLNLLGYGKTGRLRLMGGGLRSEIEALYTDPRFLGTGMRADISGAWKYEIRETFNLTQVSGNFSLSKKLLKSLTGSLTARTEWNLLSNVAPEEQEEISIDENIIVGAGPMLVHDTRDDFIDPSTGWFNRVKLEYVREIMKGDEFIRAEATGTRFIPLTPRIVFALSLNAGHIEPLGDSQAPLQEVFFVGGNRSVRGYSRDGLGPHDTDEEPLGGLEKIVTKTELRFPIYSVLHGVVFSDSGQLVNTPDELSLDNQQFTVGTGIRVMTPVGPVRLDWGYKLEPVDWERRDRWHFSFGYPF